MYCIACGSTMEVFSSSAGIYSCPSCANRYYEEDDSWEWESSEDDPFKDEIKPMACRACGDGAYPACMDGCSILGD